MKNYGKDYRRSGQMYEYTGVWYETSLSAESLKKQSVMYWAELAVLSMLFAAGLSLNNVGNRIFWILLPFAAQFLPILYGWMGSAALYRTAQRLAGAASAPAGSRREIEEETEEKAETADQSNSGKDAGRAEGWEPKAEIPGEHRRHLRRSEYEQSFRRPLRSGIGTAVLSTTVLLADVIVVLGYEGTMIMAQEFVFMGIATAMAVTGIFVAVQSWRLHSTVRKI